MGDVKIYGIREKDGNKWKDYKSSLEKYNLKRGWKYKTKEGSKNSIGRDTIRYWKFEIRSLCT